MLGARVILLVFLGVVTSDQLQDVRQNAAGLQHTGEAQPAIVGIANTRFFDYASTVAVELIQRNWQKVTVPDVTSKFAIPLLGSVELTLSDIELNELQIGETASGLQTSDQGTLILTISGLAARVHARFHWEHDAFPKLSGSGQVSAQFTDGEAQLEVAVQSLMGRPVIQSIGQAALVFGSLDVEVSDTTKLAWLLNLLLRTFSSQVQGAVQSVVASQITIQAPLQVNKLLAGIPTLVSIHDLLLNVSLAEEPQVTADAVRVVDWGRFQLPDEACPYQRATDPAAIELGGADSMLAANIDESIVNCLTWVLWRRKQLQRHFTADAVPIALDTNNWGSILPGLVKQFPNRRMTLDASVPEPLETNVSRAGLVTAGAATLAFRLEPKAGTDAGDEGQLLFRLQLAGAVRADQLLVDPDPSSPGGWLLRVRLQILASSLRVSVLESTVGNVRLAALQSSVVYLASTVLQQLVTERLLKQGFPLPDIPHIRLLNPSTALSDMHALSVGADVEYVP